MLWNVAILIRVLRNHRAYDPTRATYASMDIGFNEGKACDGVLRRLEKREGATRANGRWPEREHHAAPVEFVCSIGARTFAVEHTGIEPFEGFMRLQNEPKPTSDRLRR